MPQASAYARHRELQHDIEAHRHAARAAAKRLRSVQRHLQGCNYGLAADDIEALLDDMPNDHGGPVEHYKLLEDVRHARGAT